MQNWTWRTTAKWVALLIVAVASVYFVAEVVRHFSAIREIDWNWPAIAAMFASLAGMLLIILLGGVMWFLLLRDQGIDVGAGTAIRIVAVAQLGKYLPGNVGHLVGQAALAKAAGIPLGIAAGTMIIATLWLVAIGMGMGAFALLFFVEATTDLELPSVGTPMIAALGVALALAPWVAIWVLNRYVPALSTRLGGGRPVRLPGLPTAAALGLGFVVCFFIFGGMLALQAKFVFGAWGADWVTLTFLFTAAWVAGYLVPGAPGGLGVREALMVILLSPAVGAGAAVGLGLTMRLVTTLGDGVAFMLGSIGRHGVGHGLARFRHRGPRSDTRS